ncbi:hypothetical protein PTE30175_05467 [Pandoraea terrae]|uniref:Uncharacterized protein n=1 Tax=Pandoraea terrae TaxID=1537710 RepID=A0A5E4ZG89_9BURK|nr:hypothetical protein PTE30175_05467 [Pandoraea terrae]
MRGAAAAGRPGERPLHAVKHELVNAARIAETDFDLRRMDVDVDQLRRQIEVDDVGRVAFAMQHVFIRRPHGVREQFVANEPSVHEEELLVGAATAGGRQADEPGKPQLCRAFVEYQMRVGEIAAEHARDPGRGFRRVPVFDGPVVVQDREADFGPCEGTAADDVHAVAELGLFGLQELAPRGRIEIQVPYVDRGADGTGGGRDRPGIAVDRGGVRGVRMTARQGELGDRGDGRERFAAKAEREHRFELFETADLAGGVTRERKRQLFGRHAAAVVGDGDAAYTAFFELDLEGARAGVERVLEQFLDDGRGPFHDFPGRDLADQLVRKDTDLAARRRRGGARRRMGGGRIGGGIR